MVVEVAYNAMEGDRFRQTAQFVRWRPDREARSCGYDQLDRPTRFDVEQVLAGDPTGGGARG
jgi:ATP-dependent DNA ligase